MIIRLNIFFFFLLICIKMFSQNQAKQINGDVTNLIIDSKDFIVNNNTENSEDFFI